MSIDYSLMPADMPEDGPVINYVRRLADWCYENAGFKIFPQLNDYLFLPDDDIRLYLKIDNKEKLLNGIFLELDKDKPSTLKLIFPSDLKEMNVGYDIWYGFKSDIVYALKNGKECLIDSEETSRFVYSLIKYMAPHTRLKLCDIY